MEISGDRICKCCKYTHRKTAYGVCQQCNEPMCKQCFEFHTVPKRFPEHVLIATRYDTDALEFDTIKNAVQLKKQHLQGSFDASEGQKQGEHHSAKQPDDCGWAVEIIANLQGVKSTEYKFPKYFMYDEFDCHGKSILHMNTYLKVFHIKGITGVKKQLRKDLEQWTTIELNSAVIGMSGTGKSSFINSLRGISAKHPLAAKVGYTETTTTKAAYSYPENKGFRLWDLPGVGTDHFPKETYLEKIDYNKYDFFFIISKSRTTEIDLWLAVKIQKLNKMFFFIRSNIDTEIQNDEKDHPDSHNEQNLLNEIRKESEELLMKHGVKEPKVFLISNRLTDKYDFGKLNDALITSCDRFKKDAMALSLTKVTENVLKEKKNILEKRIPAISLTVVSSDGMYEQKGRFQDEIKFYQKQFRIDDVSIAENKDILSLSDELVEKYTVVFDETPCGKEREMTTPTTRRKAAPLSARFADCFRLSKEKKILYKCSVGALRHNLEILYTQACIFMI